MEKDNYTIVVNYIHEDYNIKQTIINEKTSLSDLGLDGDDVLDFLLKFFKAFDIEYKNTNYRDYIPRESGFLLSTFLSLFGKNEKIKIDEIFIKDLVDSLDKKKWQKM